ncbi:MAG: hypothetical protein CFK52_08440 [Chloracidobacterium sp. CP2_5A]|nr:MAG: hypothetical protein CFK52_08440 [Chloracidobacterium sp. CP2_5A]
MFGDQPIVGQSERDGLGRLATGAPPPTARGAAPSSASAKALAFFRTLRTAAVISRRAYFLPLPTAF